MTSSSLIKAFLAAFALSVLVGCIADNAEDSNLPWASNRSWEGMVPVSSSLMDRYE